MRAAAASPFAGARARARGRGTRVNPFLPAVEFGALVRDPVYWGIGVPRGDGRGVLVLPGLGGGDAYLRPLRAWLRRVGYDPIRSGLDANPGWSPELVEELGALIGREASARGRRVSIIGHSMGGLIARSIGKERVAAIDRIVTLGAPLAMGTGTLPAAVQLTAIYSRQDPIVRHPSAIARDPGSRSIEVRGSHTGLAVNRAVYRALGGLLAAPAAPGETGTPATFL